MGDKGWTRAGPLDENALDLIEADLAAAAVVQLGRAGEAWLAIIAAFSSVPPVFTHAASAVSKACR